MAFTLTSSLKFDTGNINNVVQQINNKLKNISANVNLNLPGNATRQLGSINSQIKSLTSNVKDANNFMLQFGKSAAASVRRYAGFTVFASTFYTLTKAIKGSVDEAISFQRELVRIRQVSGTSLKDLKGLTDEITNLSTSLGVSSKKLLNSAQILAQAGFSIKEINKAASTLAKIELAPTFDDVTDSTEGMIAIMGQFHTTADDFEKQFGAINAVAAKFAVESSDIITAVRRTGGAFAAAGGELNDLIALFTSVRQTSRESAETIATGFRTIFTRIQRTRTIDFLERLGINLRDDVTKQFIGPYEAVRKLSAALNSIPSTDVRFAQITEELGGFRQIGKVIPLIKQFNIAEQARIVAQRGENSLTQDAAKAQDAFAIKLQKVREEFQALIRTASENDVFKHMLDDVLKLSSVFLKLAGSLEKVAPLLLAAGAAKIGRAAIPFAKGFLPGLGVSKLGTAGAGVGVAGVVGAGLADSFGLLDDETRKLSNTFQSAGGVFLGLTFGLRTLSEFLTGNQGKLEGLRPQSQTLSREVLGGTAIAKNLYGDFANKVQGNKLLDTEINSRKSRLIANQTALNYGNLPASAAKKARAEVVIDTIHLKSLGRDRKAGEFEANDLRSRVITERSLVQFKKKELSSIDSQIKALERSEKFLSSFNIGVAAASAGLIAFGDSISQEGATLLSSGNFTGKQKFVGGRAASAGGQGASIGAATGAGIGSIVPGVGTAIGGVAGALIGGTGGAWLGFFKGMKEANDIIEKVNFDKSFDKLDKFLKDVQGGKASAAGGLTQFRGGVNLLSDRLGKASLTEKESAQGAIQNSVVGLQQFLNEISKTVDSFDELQNLVGGEVLDKFASFIGLPFAKVREEFEKQIKTQQDLIKQNNILTSAQENQLRQIQIFNKLTAALQDSIDGLTNFSDVLDGATKVKDLSGIFDRPESVVDKSLLNKAVGDTTGLLGPNAKKIGEDFSKTTEVLSKLPDVIINATSKTFNDSREFIDDFEDSLIKQFPDIPDILRNALKANVLKFRGAEGKDQKIFAEIQENPTNFIKQVGEGILDSYKEFLSNSSKLLNEQINELGGLYAKRRQVEEKLIEGLNKTTNLREQRANFGFESIGQRVPLNVAQGFENERLNAARGGSPFSTVEGFGASAGASQSRILELNQVLQTEIVNRHAVLAELETEKDALADSVRGLEFFADATSRNAHLQRELELEQKRKQSKFDFAKSFTFGDLDSRRDLGRGALAGGLLARTNDINRIPGNLRGGALSFLEGFDDTPLSFLGGKSGREVVRGTIEKNLTDYGLQPNEAKQIALNKTTPVEDKLIAGINAGFDKAIKAQDELNKLVKNEELTVLKDIKQNTEKFALLLERNFITSEKDKKKSEEIGTLSKINDSGIQQKVFGDIKSIIGEDPNKFFNVGKSLPELAGLKSKGGELQGRNARLTSFSNVVGGSDILAKLGLTAPFASPADVGFSDITREFKKKFGRDFTSEVFNSDFKNNFDTDNGTLDQFRKAFDDRIATIRKKLTEDNESFTDEKSRVSGRIGVSNNDELNRIFDGLQPLTELFKKLPENATFEGLSNLNIQAGELARTVEKLRGEMNLLSGKEADLTTRIGRAGGGFIPGSGSGDTVPAMLTPGEFVIRKDAAQAIGYDNLNDMNAQGFAGGGRAERRASYLAGKQARRNSYIAGKAGAGLNPLRQARLAEQDLKKRRNFTLGLGKPKAIIGNAALIGDKASAHFELERRRVMGEGIYKVEPKGLFVDEQPVKKGLSGEKAREYFDVERKEVSNRTGGIFDKSLSGEAARNYFERERRRVMGEGVYEAKKKELSTPERVSSFLSDFSKGVGLSFNGTVGHLAEHERGNVGLNRAGKNKLDFDFTKPVSPTVALHEFGHNLDDRIGAALGRRGKESTHGSLFQGHLEEARDRLLKGSLDLSKHTGYTRDQLLSKPQELLSTLFTHPEYQGKILGSINKKFPKGFNKGGSVQRFANGGAVQGNSGVSSQAIESLSKFVDGISKLSSSLDNFPRSVEMNVRHTIEVIHNGAQVFESLNPQMTKLVEATVGREINRLIKSKFPEVGEMQ